MRTISLTLLAALLAFVVDSLIGFAALRYTQVPKNFPPFTLLPILSGAVGGALFASLCYALIRAVSKQPEKLFLFVAVAVLALSFGLPIRLSFTKSPRFAGVTPAAQMALVLMHTVVATICVTTLLSKPNH